MVDLRANPFFLDDEAVNWVETTYESMSLREKACQLFVDPLMGMNREELKGFLDKYPIAGMSFRGAQFPLEETQDILRDIQSTVKIPMLISSDTESGANNALRGGTFIATGAQAGASDDPETAYHVTAAAATEIHAAGYNWSFGAIGDILTNWRNTLINTRAYSNDTDTVIRCCEGFIRGFKENNMVTCLKHFPGDGWEERDQHLIIGNNGLSIEEWDNTFGRVYSHFIEEGVLSIMVGHFTMPAYQRFYSPKKPESEFKPACLSPELITGLLRGKLGFNGLAFTDQTRMLGYAGMNRRDAIVESIACGLDIVLGINDMEEDLDSMLKGIEDGRITEERLKDAIYRILATKASIGLHKLQKEGRLVPEPEALEVVGCEKFKNWAVEASDSSITLVKDTKGYLPIRPETHKKLFINFIGSDFTKNLLGTGVATGGDVSIAEYVKQSFEREGFEVTMYSEDNARTKGKTADFGEKYDAAIIFADFSGFATTNSVRINWGAPMSNGCPWYEPEVPTIFISLNYTNHMIDVPRIPVFINAYNDKPYTIDLIVKKLMGESKFRGSYNENVWCGKWDTHF